MKLEDKCAKEFFEVVPRVMQILRTEMRQVVKNQLTIPQFRILAKLEHGPANCGELADWVGVSLPAVSKLSALLLKRKLIAKQRVSFDKRQWQMTLSPLGRKFFCESRESAQANLSTKLGDLSEKDKQDILTSLKTVTKAFGNTQLVEGRNESPNRISIRGTVHNSVRARADK